MDRFDIVIIGGGINGAGIARDAAGRGYCVLLCEQGDLAQATSSASTKLIHGGLRYLEQYAFGLVRAALAEREVLLRAAPHLVHPLRLVLPHERGIRPAWLIRAGLFVYDHLGRREILPGSERLDLRRHPAGAPLRDHVATGFAYSDCRVDDSRLVVANALDAHERGAQIRLRTRCTAVIRDGECWRVTLQPASGGSAVAVEARALVDATGPWVGRGPKGTAIHKIRLVKGSHIVVPRLYDGEQAYILQNTDRRIVFVIPYEGRFSLIGTTDSDYHGDPAAARCSAGETAYLCDAVNRWFAARIEPADVTWSFAGVRPLLDDETPDAARAGRGYLLDFEARPAPRLTVLGGKITTYRVLGEQVVDKLRSVLGGGAPAWTAKAHLPGGDIPRGNLDAFVAETRRARPWLPACFARRLANAYGTRLDAVLGNATDLAALGEHFGGTLYEAEVQYLKTVEWAASAQDILWRRSKTGLHIDAAAQSRLATWFL
jgi:glycerol-3-phosphate dehydrogenase